MYIKHAPVSVENVMGQRSEIPAERGVKVGSYYMAFGVSQHVLRGGMISRNIMNDFGCTRSNRALSGWYVRKCATPLELCSLLTCLTEMWMIEVLQ